jgi:hypothetical protein
MTITLQEVEVVQVVLTQLYQPLGYMLVHMVVVLVEMIMVLTSHTIVEVLVQ